MPYFECAEKIGYSTGVNGIELDVLGACKYFVDGANESVKLCHQRGGSAPDNPNCAACAISKMTPEELMKAILGGKSIETISLLV